MFIEIFHPSCFSFSHGKRMSETFYILFHATVKFLAISGKSQINLKHYFCPNNLHQCIIHLAIISLPTTSVVICHIDLASCRLFFLNRLSATLSFSFVMKTDDDCFVNLVTILQVCESSSINNRKIRVGILGVGSTQRYLGIFGLYQSGGLRVVLKVVQRWFQRRGVRVV